MMMNYGVKDFNDEINKMMDNLVSMADGNVAIQEYMDEVSEHLYEDDRYGCILGYIAYMYDLA